MTSSSTERTALCAALAWVAAVGGCQGVSHDETAAGFTRTSTAACTDLAGQTGWMDTYVIQLFEMVDPASIGPEHWNCEICIATPEVCQLERQTCVCGAPTAASPMALQDELRGIRLSGVDSENLYCLRVLAMDVGAPRALPPGACACDPAWLAPESLVKKTSLCAVSHPRGTGPLNFLLEVACPGDKPWEGDESPFNECVVP